MAPKHGIISYGRKRNTGRALKAKLRTAAVLLAVYGAVYGAAPAQAQIAQSLSYNYSADAFSTSLGIDHSLSGMELRILDFSFNQSTSYDLDTGRLGDYQAGLDINDEENFFGNVSGVLGAEARSVGAFVDNRFARDRFEIGLSASGNLEWNKSTFGDEGLLDPDFDIFEFTDEELDAAVWVRSHFLESAYSAKVNQFSIGRLKVRPVSDGTIGHSDFGGLTYSIAGATGFSIAPKDGDDEFSFFFEESNLTADVPGGNYGAGDGEVVFAAGHDSDGLTKLAALIFKSFEPSDKVEFTFDATGSLQYRQDQGFGIDSGTVQLGSRFRPTEDISIDAALSAGISEDFIPTYSFEASLDYSRFLSFTPYARFSAFYSDGTGDFSWPIGFDATLYDKLLLSAEILPTYSTFDQSYGVDLSGRLTMIGPSFFDEGLESEFSISANASMITGEHSVTLDGTFNF
jgi:hypothetical protein